MNDYIILYRTHGTDRTRSRQVQGRDDSAAVAALARTLGHWQFVVISIRSAA